MMRSLAVEIHDVCPASAPEVEVLLGLVENLGFSRPTLLVVPRYLDRGGRAWDLRESPALIDRLVRLVHQGAEVVLHGLTHRALEPPPRGAWRWFMHHVFSQGEAEFAHLDYADARARLSEGRALLRSCGLPVEGFIAPVWQQSAAAATAVADAGFRFTAFLDRVVYFADPGAPLPSPALTFCAPHGAVDHGKRLAMRGVAHQGRRASLLRVALHPEDVHAPGRLEHVRRRLEALGEKRVQWQYRQGLPAARGRAA